MRQHSDINTSSYFGAPRCSRSSRRLSGAASCREMAHSANEDDIHDFDGFAGGTLAATSVGRPAGRLAANLRAGRRLLGISHHPDEFARTSQVSPDEFQFLHRWPTATATAEALAYERTSSLLLVARLVVELAGEFQIQISSPNPNPLCVFGI